MAMSAEARRRFCRCIEEMRRGKVPSSEVAADLLRRLDAVGLKVAEADPDLAAMAAVLKAAGYQVVAPNG